MNEFTPSSDYQSLVIQANALHSINVAQERVMTSYREQIEELKAQLAEAGTAENKAQWQETVVAGSHVNLLPALGSTVFFRLASSNSWEPFTVTGFYVWPSLEPNDKINHRVFVVGKDADGYSNSRLLADIRNDGDEVTNAD